MLSVLAPPGARHRYADCELLPLAKDLASLSAPMDAPFMQTGLSGKLLKDDEYCYCHWEGCQGPTKHVRSKWLRQQVL